MPAVRSIELDDDRYCIATDRADAVRFRQLVKSALRGDVWLSRMAASPAGNPKTIDEVRSMLDYVIQRDKTS